MLRQRSPSAADLTEVPPPKRQCAEASSEEPSAGSEQGGVRQQVGALAGARTLAAVMRLEAPAHTTLQGVYDLLEACSVLLADEVVRHVPAYVKPALSKASLLEVRVGRCLRSCVCL